MAAHATRAMRFARYPVTPGPYAVECDHDRDLASVPCQVMANRWCGACCCSRCPGRNPIVWCESTKVGSGGHRVSGSWRYRHQRYLSGLAKRTCDDRRHRRVGRRRAHAERNGPGLNACDRQRYRQACSTFSAHAPLLGRRFRDADTPGGAGRRRADLTYVLATAPRGHARGARSGAAPQRRAVHRRRRDGTGLHHSRTARRQLWIPIHVPPTVTPGSKNGNIKMFSAMARLKPTATVAQAAAEARARAQSAPHAGPLAIAVFGSAGQARMTLVPALDDATREVRPGLLVLLAAVALLLAASVANVANVQLARAASRRRELAIRSALGADQQAPCATAPGRKRRRRPCWRRRRIAAGHRGGRRASGMAAGRLPSRRPDSAGLAGCARSR